MTFLFKNKFSCKIAFSVIIREFVSTLEGKLFGTEYDTESDFYEFYLFNTYVERQKISRLYL